MIKFLGTRDGRPLLGFGLSRGNCERLLEGKPIFIDLKVMCANASADLNDAVMLIFGGETETEMQMDLAKLVGPLPKAQTHKEEN